MSNYSKIIEEDCAHIIKRVGSSLDCLKNKSLLITGANGFLCSYFVDVINKWNKSLEPSNRCFVHAIDNFSSSKKTRLKHLINENEIKFYNTDVSKSVNINDVDYIIHGASIASPSIYRIYPLETLDANVAGTRNVLKLAILKKVTNVVIMSSSEVYGDPDNNNIPTNEQYNGNVSCEGPRACYDESKRIAETLAYVYKTKYKLAVNTIRPFNVFGPGQNLDDKRLVPDCIKSVLNNSDIEIFSDGKSTRSFCYVSDAVSAILLLLLKQPKEFLAFNVGNDEIEITMKELADLVLEVGKRVIKSNTNKVIFKKSFDVHYNTDSPKRRSPDLSRIKSTITWNPIVSLEKGIERTIKSYL
tara:strand:+ start:818 stop:1891 length:1074 start_codon:yes stop_codon:yes gene_type:complete